MRARGHGKPRGGDVTGQRSGLCGGRRVCVHVPGRGTEQEGEGATVISG